MAQVVHAKCPRCSSVLRIPAEWVHQPMRCKNCNQIFQAQVKMPAPVVASPSPSSRTPLPSHTTRPAAGILVSAGPSGKPAGSPFNFGRSSSPEPRRGRPPAGGKSLWKGAVVGVCVVGLAAALIYFGRDHIARLIDNSPAVVPDQSFNSHW